MTLLKSLVVVAVLATAGAAQAQEPPKLHMANVLSRPIDFQAGPGPERRLPAGQWAVYDLPVGTHRVIVRLGNGEELGRTGMFKDSQATAFGRGRYWCAAVVGVSETSDADPALLLLTPEQCKRVLDAGGPID